MLVINKIGKISGRITVPGDKSISHRAIMLAAISSGRSVIEGFLNGQDCLSTMNCFQSLGIEIQQAGQRVEIQGKGLYGLQEPTNVLDAGNSGTTMRLMSGILAGQNFMSIITGDSSLRQRPMARVTAPLQKMGARIDGRVAGQYAPLVIRGGGLQGITWQTPVASAQIKSAVLLAGLYAAGKTTVEEPMASRDHTERMLACFGVPVERSGAAVTVGKGSLSGQRIKVPGDISSAAFFLAAAAAQPGAQLVIQNVGLNPTRTGIIDVLRQMGADIRLDNVQSSGGEEAGDLIVTGGELHGTEVNREMIPRLIDEIPVLAVAAALAHGATRITGAEELKVKESNRLAAMAAELGKMGVAIRELPDGLLIEGSNQIKGAAINSYHDHRIAMAMAVCGLFAQGETRIADSDCIDISFPGFSNLLQQITQ
ncbi:MAG: 3-phosphoshikimate 1-carboxyvinyltransferase [Veillonellales bacterium]